MRRGAEGASGKMGGCGRAGEEGCARGAPRKRWCAGWTRGEEVCEGAGMERMRSPGTERMWGMMSLGAEGRGMELDGGPMAPGQGGMTRGKDVG